MKVAFVNNQLQLGGAETVLEQLRRGITAQGHTATVYVAEGKTYPADIQPLYPSFLSRVSHTRLHAGVEKFFPRAQWTDEAFRRLAVSDADLIHVHNFHGNYASIASLAHVARHKPLIWTFHAFWGVTGGCDHPGDCRRYQRVCGACPQLGVWPLGFTDNTSAQLQRKFDLLSGLPLHIVAPSRFLAEQVAASRVGRAWNIHHIPNGVATDRVPGQGRGNAQRLRELGLPGEGRPTILVVNRNFQDERKGFPMVREALQTAVDRLQVIFVGQNSDWAARQFPEIPAASLGYVGDRARLTALYELADIFLFASQAENFPCVILEAMAAGCCVVATPIGGVIEQVRHREHGFLSSTVSGPALARALDQALADPDARISCSLNARRRVAEEFSESHMVMQYLDVYRQAIEAQREDGRTRPLGGKRQVQPSPAEETVRSGTL